MGLFSKLFGAGKGGNEAPGGGLGIAELSRRLGKDESSLRAIRIEYREFKVPKRSGKMRTLAAPSAELKAVQRVILRRLLGRLAAHEAATGFERGHSIVTNAAVHVGRAVVVRVDLKDFFTTTKAERVEAYFRAIGWDKDAAPLLTRLCTHKGSLPQGAPTSPRLSNLVNRMLDVRVQALAATLHARYSRYADDLTFSFDEDDRERIHGLTGFLPIILKDYGYQMHMKRKLHIRRRHQRQEVTGLVVNDRVALPRATRRWLRAIEHRMAIGGAPTLSPRQVAGWTALRGMVDAAGAGEPGDGQT